MAKKDTWLVIAAVVAVVVIASSSSSSAGPLGKTGSGGHWTSERTYYDRKNFLWNVTAPGETWPGAPGPEVRWVGHRLGVAGYGKIGEVHAESKETLAALMDGAA